MPYWQPLALHDALPISSCYTDDASTKSAWMNGQYDDAAPIIRAFALHREEYQQYESDQCQRVSVKTASRILQDSWPVEIRKVRPTAGSSYAKSNISELPRANNSTVPISSWLPL